MIRDQLSNLTMGIRSYLDNLQMKMSPVFNSSLSHILTTLHGVMDVSFTHVLLFFQIQEIQYELTEIS